MLNIFNMGRFGWWRRKGAVVRLVDPRKGFVDEAVVAEENCRVSLGVVRAVGFTRPILSRSGRTSGQEAPRPVRRR